MRKFIFIPVFLALLFCSTQLHAQNLDTVVTQVVEAPIEEEEITAAVDTTLYFYDHTMPGDSIESWRNSKAFAYTKYLDSLLKIKEAKASSKTSKPKNKSKSSSSSSTPTESTYDSSSSSGSFLSSSGLSVFLWILAIAFVLFILYKLFLSESLFKRKSKEIKTEQVQQPELEEEIVNAESDFQRLIRLAVTAGNYRLAVRYQYLQSLHLLAARNYLSMAVDKTNYQYVQEIKRHEIRNDFAALTLNYEYVWYGEFDVEPGIYQKLDALFSAFNKKI